MFYIEYKGKIHCKEEVFAFLDNYDIEGITLEELINLDICFQQNKKCKLGYKGRKFQKDLNLAIKRLDIDFFEQNIPKIRGAYKLQLHIFFERNYEFIENYEDVILELLDKKLLEPRVIIKCNTTLKHRKNEFIGFLLGDTSFVPLIVELISDGNKIKINREDNFIKINELIEKAYLDCELQYFVLDQILKMSGDWFTPENKFRAKQKLNAERKKIVNSSAPYFSFSITISPNIDILYEINMIEQENSSILMTNYYNVRKHFSSEKTFLSKFKLFESDLGFLEYGQFSLSRYKDNSIMRLLVYSHEKDFLKGINIHYEMNDISTFALTKLCHEYLTTNNTDILKILSFIYDFEMTIYLEMSETLYGIVTSESYKVKCSSICSAIEEALKKVDYYTKNGKLDLEVIENIQITTNINNIKSKNSIKNLYLSDKFFSDSISYLFTENEMGKTLCELLCLGINDICELSECGFDEINTLLETNIFELINNKLIYSKRELIMLTLIYKQGSISYTSLVDDDKKIVDRLIYKKYIDYDSLLFSREELNVYSYYMNNAKFVDGPYLRNKYQHGNAIASSDEEFYNDYIKLLRLFILISLKIYNDLNKC